MEVKDFLDDRGLAENDWELVLDYIKNPHFKNVLKKPHLVQKS